MILDFAILFSLACEKKREKPANLRMVPADSYLVSDDSQRGSEDLAGWLRDLRSKDSNQRYNAKRAIVAMADGSIESRKQVVSELLKLARAQNATSEFARSPERFLEWKEVTDILGELKSTEAIDVLIQCLDCNNGHAGRSPDRFPAARAIIMIGKPAIPKLAEALQSESAGTRLMAAEALYAIGGPESKEALKGAAQGQRYKETAAVVRDMLLNWERSGKR